MNNGFNSNNSEQLNNNIQQPINYSNNGNTNNNNFNNRYKPLSPWSYVGYQLLFSIPIIGFIILLIYAFSDDNINRKNYARSYFCIYLIAAIVFVFILLIMLIATN